MHSCVLVVWGRRCTGCQPPLLCVHCACCSLLGVLICWPSVGFVCPMSSEPNPHVHDAMQIMGCVRHSSCCLQAAHVHIRVALRWAIRAHVTRRLDTGAGVPFVRRGSACPCVCVEGGGHAGKSQRNAALQPEALTWQSLDIHAEPNNHAYMHAHCIACAATARRARDWLALLTTRCGQPLCHAPTQPGRRVGTRVSTHTYCSAAMPRRTGRRACGAAAAHGVCPPHHATPRHAYMYMQHPRRGLPPLQHKLKCQSELITKWPPCGLGDRCGSSKRRMHS